MEINITHLSKLANLSITKSEEAKFNSQLSSILTYIKRLNEVDTENIEETSQVTGLENILEEDVVQPSLSQQNALSQAKGTANKLFSVKGIFENE